MYELADQLSTVWREPEEIYKACLAVKVKYAIDHDINLCAERIRDPGEAGLIIMRANLNQADFDLTGAPIVFWKGILERAVELQDGLVALMTAIRERFQNRVDLADDPLRRWKPILDRAWGADGRDRFSGLVSQAVVIRPELRESLEKALADEIQARLSATTVAVKEAFRSLGSLMQDPAIVAEVRVSRGVFESTHSKIEILGAFKELHDLLHDLQFRSYNAVAEQVQAVIDGNSNVAWDKLANQAQIELADIVTQLRDVASRNILPSFQTIWIDELSKAYDELDDALSSESREGLTSAGMRFGRVIRTQPARLAQEADSAAQYLQLGQLAEALERIRKSLVQQGADPQLLVDLDKGVAALCDMNRELAALIVSHNRWQILDNEFRRIEDTKSYSSKVFVQEWQALNLEVESLLGADSDPRSEKFRASIKKLSAALAAGNPAEVANYFMAYRRQQSLQFFKVDKALLGLCERLRSLGDPLNSIVGRF